MKKAFPICIVLIMSAVLAKAQSITVTGTVKNEQGGPIHYVFVEDNQGKTGAFTDSTGSFSVVTSPNAALEFRRKGYVGAVINVANNTSLEVTLKPDGSATANPGKLTTAAQDNSVDNSLPVSLAHKKDQVQGNQYLFEDFAHGYVINPGGALVYNPDYLYDYDKIKGSLLFTADNKSVAEINADQIKIFVLYSNTDQRYVFKMVPDIDKTHYTQVLASGKNYEIYKFTKTHFVKSDYVAAGLTSHGNNYDEFVDDVDYYVLDVTANKLQKLSLKKKSLKEVFAKDLDKVNKFMSNNSSSDIDDIYLSKLGYILNE